MRCGRENKRKLKLGFLWGSGIVFGLSSVLLGAEIPDFSHYSPLSPPETFEVVEKKFQSSLSSAPGKTEPAENRKIEDLQIHSSKQSLVISNENTEGSVELTNLNPSIGRWFLMRIRWPNTQEIETYHLENPFGLSQTLLLQEGIDGLVIKNSTSTSICDLWSNLAGYPLKVGRVKSEPYFSLCDGKLFLRNQIKGYSTTKEWVVEFLRTNVWGGESIATFVKTNLYQDRFIIHSSGETSNEKGKPKSPEDANYPISASTHPQFRDLAVKVEELGIQVFEKNNIPELQMGHWYPTWGQKDVYVSAIMPKTIGDEILNSHKETLPPLDKVEKNALILLVAFDLTHFELGYGLGTDHPKVDWSARIRPKDRKPSKAGPDGIDHIRPLISTGLINPIDARRVVGTFTGGFKRSHGAFKWGKLAKVNQGSHYGFIESGVVLSRPQPGLGTIFVQNNGDVIMKTWDHSDLELSSSIKYLRQNGVPLIAFDGISSQPGSLVGDWMKGNWSGSQDKKFRTLRAGLCLQYRQGKKFLVYAYFSSVTPVAMARVFQAYGCQYAIHLDMNALEHTYLALYVPSKEHQGLAPQHLVKGMQVLDQRKKGNVPRFIGYPDNRDYFYLLRKKSGEIK